MHWCCCYLLLFLWLTVIVIVICNTFGTLSLSIGIITDVKRFKLHNICDPHEISLHSKLNVSLHVKLVLTLFDFCFLWQYQSSRFFWKVACLIVEPYYWNIIYLIWSRHERKKTRNMVGYVRFLGITFFVFHFYRLYQRLLQKHHCKKNPPPCKFGMQIKIYGNRNLNIYCVLIMAVNEIECSLRNMK